MTLKEKAKTEDQIVYDALIASIRDGLMKEAGKIPVRGECMDSYLKGYYNGILDYFNKLKGEGYGKV